MTGCMPPDSDTRCPLCLGTEFIPVVKRDGVPVFQNVLFKYRKDAIDVDRASLDVVACGRCGFVFNAAFEPARADYDQQYDNTQTHSAEFSAYLAQHVRHLVQDLGPARSTIVEVGSGNGWFLERLVSAAAGSIGFGFDPAYRGPEFALDGRIRYLKRYFQPQDAALRADVVVCRHVIEHVADPVGLLRSVRSALSGSTAPRVVFETPCVKWILKNRVFWDFFYEHCSYFSPESLGAAFAQAGFAVQRLERVFGGQYLWLEGSPTPEPAASTFDPGDIPTLASSFARAEAGVRTHWLQQVRSLRVRGKVAVWGAGAKGVTFLNAIDPAAGLIDCAVDISPDKQDRYIAGTGHPVVGVEQLAERQIASAILMNPNYRAENLRLLQTAQADVALV